MTPTFHDQDGPGGVCLCYALVCWCYMETWVEVWRHQGRPAQDKPTDSQTKNASNSNPHVALLPTVLCARHNWPAEHSCMSRIHAGSQAYSIAASDCRRCMQAHLSLHETQLSHRMHTARSVLLGYRRGRNPAPLLGGGLHRHRPVVSQHTFAVQLLWLVACTCIVRIPQSLVQRHVENVRKKLVHSRACLCRRLAERLHLVRRTKRASVHAFGTPIHMSTIQPCRSYHAHISSKPWMSSWSILAMDAIL